MPSKSTGRKRSVETQLREVKRELKSASAQVLRYYTELEARRSIGDQMANTCFNLGQENATFPSDWPRTKATMTEMRVNWDAIKRQP
jgi:hypothetical protein